MAKSNSIRENLVILPKTSVKDVLFYFGGDIQDWPERMSLSRENRRFSRWNLQTTGEILSKRFPESAIVVIRPDEMKDDVFSRFSNFVPKINDFGDPLTYDTCNNVALHHLNVLSEQLIRDFSSFDITLLGFSKGCVVLNQILHELTDRRERKTIDELSSFVSQIVRMIWLDGGHNNGKLAMIWPNERNLILTLKEFHIRTEVYVTPFQIDSTNSHKKFHFEHYKTFSNLLKTICDENLFVNQMFFADDLPSSIEKHFELLETFRRST